MMTEMEAVNARHSVRSYKDQKIEADKAAQLKALIEQCNQEGNLHLQLLEEAGSTFGRLLSKVMGLASAPSVIACVGPDDETVEERIGYYGEKVVLLAQQLGLNTCWAGTFNAGKVPCKVLDGERLVIVIAIGYGQNSGRIRRTKTVEQVIRGNVAEMPEWMIKGAECALKAPTAINQQKFEFVLKDDGTVGFVDKGGIFSKVDLGIIRYHFELGSKNA